ncbi:gliding motility-associated C-terminal domain-containing protein [Pedobacter sp. N36a]|uniref:gliding motility-associated C-terminal domain-containing protein n=1 Tax=Pedobacter sp. N36a TaxID=2767996 RepID=UPI0016571D19|nr:gliding motility-associated C-terminal domain-containing protein [Pedobacter sp. N36a]MBC8984409.1 gliding motility-associated C-terminal domain-containing protein [Pedobacter sp. N36a]
MKKIIASLALSFLLLPAVTLKAQLKVNSESLFIQNGTVFSTEGLTLVPSTDLQLNNLTISKQPSVVIFPKFNSIQRMYRFSKPVSFEGELALSYENVELNGNEAKNLVLTYAPMTSNNAKDFMQVTESVVNTDQRYIGQLFAKAILLSDVTAVSMALSVAKPYADLEGNNMITPNGDGKNDTWIVKNIQLYPNNELKIFDREGRVVFSMFGYDNSWDGMFNGIPLQEDTYYYILTLDSGKGKKTGFISIVRDK